MAAKDRISVILASNAVGEQVPLAYMGKSKKPRCLDKELIKLLNYMSQSRAWADKRITQLWFSNVFLLTL